MPPPDAMPVLFGLGADRTKNAAPTAAIRLQTGIGKEETDEYLVDVVGGFVDELFRG